jgi:hypothetical protein
MYSTQQSEKKAAAERVAALWRSKIAAQRQLVSATNSRHPRRVMEPALSSQYPPQRRAHFADSPPSRSRSRSRERPRPKTKATRNRPRGRSSWDSSSGDGASDTDSPSRSQRSSDKPSTEQVPRELTNPGQNQEAENSRNTSNSSKVAQVDRADPGKSPKLVGVEVESPQEQSLFALFLKSVIGSGDTLSNNSSGRDLLSQALAHPKQAGR